MSYFLKIARIYCKLFDTFIFLFFGAHISTSFKRLRQAPVFVIPVVLVSFTTLGTKLLANENPHKTSEVSSEGLQLEVEGPNMHIFPKKQPQRVLGVRPDKPQLKTPYYFEKITTPEIKLSWNPVNGATSYHVQVATDPNFKWLVSEEFLFQGTEYLVKELKANKHYFWRVAAVNNKNAPRFIKGYFEFSMFETQ